MKKYLSLFLVIFAVLGGLGFQNANSAVVIDGYKYGAAAFSPNDIANLEQWLDASDTATITHSSGLVSQWNDKKNSYNATSSGSERPTTGTQTLNSLNTIYFSGDVRMTANTPDSISNAANTVFAVYSRDNGADGSDYFIIIAYRGGSDSWGLRGGDFGGKFYQFVNKDNVGGANNFTRPSTSDTAFIHVGKFDGTTNAYSAGTGSSGWSSAFTSAGAVSTLNGTYIGNSTSNNADLNGRLGEILVYSRELTASEVNQVNSYLSTKWGAANFTVSGIDLENRNYAAADWNLFAPNDFKIN